MRKSTMGGIIALLLAGLLTITAGVGSAVNGKWFKNSDIKTWFNSWGKDKQEIVQPENPDNGGNVIVTPDNNDGLIQLASAPLMVMTEDGVERAVPDSYVITATVDSNDSSLQNITWAYFFENTSAEWAIGKNVNNYCEFNISSDTKQLTVKAKQAFGEPICITASASVASNISSTCKVDYIKRISSVDFSVNQYNLFALGKANDFEMKPEFTVGTVSGELTIVNVYADLSDALFASFANMLSAAGAYHYIQPCSYTFTPAMAVNPFHFLNTVGGGGGYVEISGSNIGKLCYNDMLRGAVSVSDLSTNDYLVMRLSYSYIFNGLEIQNGDTLNKDIKYSKGDLTEFNVVTKVNLDNTHIYL